MRYIFSSLVLLPHRCKTDKTVQIYTNGSRSKVQFAMKAFKYMGHHDQVKIRAARQTTACVFCLIVLCRLSWLSHLLCGQVYITCSVILCEAGMTNSRCSQGCSRSIQITKREASFQSATNHTSGHQIHKRDVPSEATGYFLSHSHHKINEREASYQTSGHFISQGPVRLRHQIDNPGKTFRDHSTSNTEITGLYIYVYILSSICASSLSNPWPLCL